MEKDSNYLENYEPTLQSVAMRIACEHLGKVVAPGTPLPSICNKFDMQELIIGFEMEFDMDIIEEEKNIETLNDIVELIRVRSSEEELKERMKAILIRSLNSPNEDEPESENEVPILSNPAEGMCDQVSVEEQQVLDKMMDYLSNPDNDLDGLANILAKQAK